MGNHVKARPRSRPKPKSVKAKINRQMGSKRRTQRMGKELKKGQKGAAASFLTRAQVLRRLQISLRDFRRLCILKGVYPRDPSKKVSGKDKTYYHIKDVGFLAHEPVLQSFRDFKAFMRKLRRAISRKGLQDAQRRELNERPVYKLDHLVKERYPRFLDAIRDLDDALSLVHLFASLPQMKERTSAHTETCKRLVKEWTYYVSKAKCLSKVFVSIKGVYFQAEILGLPVTWIVPHMFTNHYPRDVDFSIMLTFLEFYETFLKFVMLKLFHTLDLRYPPVLDAELESVDAGLAVVKTQTVDGDGDGDSRPDGVEEEEEEHRVLPSSQEERRAAKKKVRAEERRLQSLEAKLAKIARADKAAAAAADEGTKGEHKGKEKGGDGDDAEDAEMGEALTVPLAEAFRNRGDDEDDNDENGDGEEEAFGGEGEGDGEEARRKRLFKGLKFFLGREVPKSWMEFVVMSCGGTVGWEGEGSPFTSGDPSITHQVVDRPTMAEPRRKRREYVQPQWVLDSLNARMLLPVARYAPGAMLPPHLSPFVDDAAEGYVPAYREELDKLRSAAEARRDRDLVPGEDVDDGSGARNVPMEMDVKGEGQDGNPEEAYARDLERERAGTTFSKAKEEEQKQQEEEGEEEEGEEVGESASSEEDREREQPQQQQQQTEEQEHHELSKTMMSKKAKRLYGRMQYGLNKRRDEVEKLKVKRRMLEAKYDATPNMAKNSSSKNRRKLSKKNKGLEAKEGVEE